MADSDLNYSPGQQGAIGAVSTAIMPDGTTKRVVVPGVMALGPTGAAIAYADAAGYPEGATVLQVSSGNVTNAVAAVTLAKAVTEMVYLTGFDVSFGGATAASNVLLTITGLEGDDRVYVVSVPAGATVAGAGFSRTFDPPLPAEDLNTDIVVSLAALGAGNTHACVNAQGYRV